MAILENVEGIGDPKKDFEAGVEEFEGDFADDLEFDSDTDEFAAAKTVSAQRSAREDCKARLESLGFIVTLYLFDNRKWGMPQSRRRWCLASLAGCTHESFCL